MCAWLLLASAPLVVVARLGGSEASKTGAGKAGPKPGDANVTLTQGFTLLEQHTGNVSGQELLHTPSAPPLGADQLLPLNSTMLGLLATGGYGGYDHMATTTVYGDSQHGACGNIKTADLVAGTNYHNVASAQSMWRGCVSHGNCMCGASGGGGGTAGMGCFTCGKGRFLESAYGTRGGNGGRLLLEGGSGYLSEEVIFVVGDLCPHAGNEDWCPEMAGQENDYGVHNHLDFSHPPAGVMNNNFVFSHIECPADLRHRFQKMAPGCGAAR
jgi:hypothetical protein